MSITEQEAKALAESIIIFFNERRGFDGWWDTIDEDVKKELTNSLEKHILNYLKED